MNNKILIILPVLLALVFSISASDFSLRGNRDLYFYGDNYAMTFSAWHNNNQGHGSISIEGKYFKEYLKFEQIRFYEYQDYIYVIVRARGSYWQKGIKPVPVDFNLRYIYYKNLNTVHFEGFSIPIKVV